MSALLVEDVPNITTMRMIRVLAWTLIFRGVNFFYNRNIVEVQIMYNEDDLARDDARWLENEIWCRDEETSEMKEIANAVSKGLFSGRTKKGSNWRIQIDFYYEHK